MPSESPWSLPSRILTVISGMSEDEMSECHKLESGELKDFISYVKHAQCDVHG